MAGMLTISWASAKNELKKFKASRRLKKNGWKIAKWESSRIGRIYSVLQSLLHFSGIVYAIFFRFAIPDTKHIHVFMFFYCLQCSCHRSFYISLSLPVVAVTAADAMAPSAIYPQLNRTPFVLHTLLQQKAHIQSTGIRTRRTPK